MALKTEAADSSETSCSPLRPPNRIPTRSFFMKLQCGRSLAPRQFSMMMVWVRVGTWTSGIWICGSGARDSLSTHDIIILSEELHHEDDFGRPIQGSLP